MSVQKDKMQAGEMQEVCVGEKPGSNGEVCCFMPARHVCDHAGPSAGGGIVETWPLSDDEERALGLLGAKKDKQDDRSPDLLTVPEKDVWAILILKHGLSYNDARRTCYRVARDMQRVIENARDNPDVPPEVRS